MPQAGGEAQSDGGGTSLARDRATRTGFYNRIAPPPSARRSPVRVRKKDWLATRRRAEGGRSARRYGLFPAVVVKAALGLATEPTGLDVFHQQRAGAVLGIRQALIEDLHDGQAGVEADEVGKLERTHRVVGAKPHGLVDRFNRADALIERVDGLVDHRQQNAIDDKG